MRDHRAPRCRRPTRRWRRRAPRSPAPPRRAPPRRGATLGRVAHLHLHRREACGAPAPTNGPSTSAFTGIVGAHRGREAGRVAASSAARRHTRGIATDSRRSGEHSPQPAGPSSSVTARSPIRRRCSRQDRHSPTLTSTATDQLQLRRAAPAPATSDGGSVRVSTRRTGCTASGSASRPSSAHGCVMPIATTDEERADVARDEQAPRGAIARRAPRACACRRRCRSGRRGRCWRAGSRTPAARRRARPTTPRRARTRPARTRSRPSRRSRRTRAPSPRRARCSRTASARRCRAPRRRSRRRPTSSSHGFTTSDSTRPATAATPNASDRGALHRAAASRSPVAVSRTGPLRSSSVPRTPSE